MIHIYACFRERNEGVLNKYQRYRHKMISQGKCPHCGKPCAPFYECEDRRKRKSMSKLLRRMVWAGILSREIKPGKPTLYSKVEQETKIEYRGRKISSWDRRFFPRINKKYINIEEICIEILREEENPLHIKELYKRFLQKLSKMKSEMRG